MARPSNIHFDLNKWPFQQEFLLIIFDLYLTININWLRSVIMFIDILKSTPVFSGIVSKVD